MMNPLRDVVKMLGNRAAGRPSPFREEADSVLDGFRQGRRELEAKVRRGDLTPKVAREQAATMADGIGRAIKGRAAEFTTTSRVFLDRLIQASKGRAAAAERASLEGLQRETNRLLRSVLVEQQIQVRAPEFEGRAFVRPVAGGKPAPTLEGLLDFHKSASLAGDDPAVEWSRRQLEGYRPMVVNPEDHRRIDLATDRPDRVNPRLVGTYVDAMVGSDHESMETFVTESIAAKDTNACMAAFVLARDATEGSRLRWVRMVLEGVNSFPDAAIATLRELEVEARAADRDAAMTHADYVAAQAHAEAGLAGLEAPTMAELKRLAEIESRPVAKLGESIGLTLGRRGAFEGESESVEINPIG